ncbi:hypothetical protein AKG39_05100 [Acetobacterium bakii]|uniref:Uncharacterized protein n=2 Tax=Acetobacterium bakii TaxID=52689 RepID=A0A0L6U4I9_9FIRM|nr:hypothetical protein AKG39_05100 [Acetobacterium bakii]
MERTKKEIITEYKERKILGGIFVIRNIDSGKILVDSTTNLQGAQNLFAFSKKTGSCGMIKLQKDWTITGKDRFVFEVLEELEKGETQTLKEYKDDIEVLKLMWKEKLANATFY